MRYYYLALLVVVIAVVGIAGFRGTKTENRPIEIFPDMDHQAKVKPQKPSSFFGDGRGARMPIPGTISASVPIDQEYLMTGAIGNQWGDGIPVQVTPQLMMRGAERYAINCQVCHGASGAGNGIVTQYGLAGVANYHTDRFRQMPDGEIFNTITKGKGQMMGYGANIAPEDRWAIVAYIRALQRSQNATGTDVPEAERAKLVNP
jgi:mono/diheme cytochrome c family protein